MPPKKRLPRRRKAANGELNLEAVSEERIDAVTAEPLDAVNFIEVLSPDKTLRLFYNTSTLIRIAVDKGGFMQPPHFREPMSNALRKRIEEIEGKKFHFEAHNSVMPRDDTGEAGALAVLHRHVYFDQIMDEFYLLNPAEIYVCPVCYEHYVRTRYIPAMQEERRNIRHLRNGTPVADPLDVLSYMHSEDRGTGDDDGAPIVLDAAWDNILVHIVFRKALQWKAHMQKHHAIVGIGAGDYRLRDVLCTYYNTYNQWNEEKYEEDVQQHGDGKKKIALTQQRYWHVNASYNRLRYNRIVAATELAVDHPEAVTQSSFPHETIAHHFNPEAEDEGDFIDDEESDEEGDYVAPYSPEHEGFAADEENEEEEEDGVEVAAPPPRKRRHDSSTESTSDSSSTSGSSTTDSSSSDESYDGEVQKQRALFKRGLLAERDCYYSRLSAEDQRFFERSQRSNVAPSQLYDPRMHQVSTKNSAAEEDVDWENIGEALPAKKTEHVSKPISSEAAVTPSRTTMLLDDAEDAKPNVTSSAEAVRPSHAPRILLDEDK